MVKLIYCSLNDFIKNLKGEKLVCFGAGTMLDYFCEKNRQSGFRFEQKISYIIDNNKALNGTFKTINNINIPIVSYEQFISKANRNIIILITNTLSFNDILKQLDNEPALNGIECYISRLFDSYRGKAVNIDFTKNGNIKIPKKVHYCWFGGNQIPVYLQEYMKSWSRLCPDYEIIRWDEHNYDITKNLYMKQAYEAKKWAFASDYARLDIIYNHGGIYLDTDVELLKPLDDLLYDDMFCGFESRSYIAFGLGFGAVKNHYIVKSVLDKYNELTFVNSDGIFNFTPCPVYQSEVMKNYGFIMNNTHQNINGISVYPCEVLCPKSTYMINDCFTENTYSIHHYNASWVENNSTGQKEVIEAYRQLSDRIFNLTE